MKKILLLLMLATPGVVMAQSWKEALKGLVSEKTESSTTEEQSSSSSSLSLSNLANLSESLASDGLKEALAKGVSRGVTELSATDGYLGNELVKIAFPEEIQMVEKALRKAGMDKVADKGVELLNRAAEDAASSAADIFTSAITEMTIQDAVGIVAGSDDAGTEYLKKHTTNELTEKFSPIIEESLGMVNATSYWKTVMSKYNALPFVQKQIEPDLTKYVAEKAVDGMFVKIAEEEKLIRKDPLERTTEILEQVFN
ncbi:MAG: DUF4197 domain-containing protein [Mangrovibacterium sp.]